MNEHYKERAVETVLIRERFAERMAATGCFTQEQVCNLYDMAKYLPRAGYKDGEDWEKDVDKAADYAFRAFFPGKWARDYWYDGEAIAAKDEQHDTCNGCRHYGNVYGKPCVRCFKWSNWEAKDGA